MDAGEVVAVCAAVISLIALWFGALSAKAAGDSAGASVRSAAASEESVRLASAIRDLAEKPKFEYAARYVRDGEVHVMVKMLEGPEQIEVSADYIAESKGPLSEPGSGGVQAAQITLARGSGPQRSALVRNEPMSVGVKVRADAVGGSVQVTLRCEEVGEEERQWHDLVHVPWEKPLDQHTRVSRVRFTR